MSTKLQQGTAKGYFFGFIASLILILAAYFLVVGKLLSGWPLISAVVLFGFGQAMIQMVLCFNLNSEKKPRWNLLMFLFMVLIVVILVVGSLWIMSHLDYQMMPMMDLHHQ